MARTLSLTTAQQVLLTVERTTMAGAPASVYGTVSFMVLSGDCAIVPLTPLQVWLVAGDLPGDTTILVEAEIDAGAGFHHVAEILHVSVQGEHAGLLGLTVSEPAHKQPLAQGPHASAAPPDPAASFPPFPVASGANNAYDAAPPDPATFLPQARPRRGRPRGRK